MRFRNELALLVFSLFALPAYSDMIDMTTTGDFKSINGAWFEQINPQSTGTGYIDPFLRIQSDTTEQGYNTDAKNPPFDTKAGTWTHAITLAEFLPVTYKGTEYIKFMLDLNEVSSGDNSLISLDQVKIYVNGSDGALNTTNLSALGTPVYDLDSNTDNWVKMTAALNDGSGSGDYYMYIPVSVFGQQGLDSRYLYLFTRFGDQGTKTNGLDSSDGFEEWAAIRGTPPVPEPTFYGLLSVGITGLLFFSRKRRQHVE